MKLDRHLEMIRKELDYLARRKIADAAVRKAALDGVAAYCETLKSAIDAENAAEIAALLPKAE